MSRSPFQDRVSESRTDNASEVNRGPQLGTSDLENPIPSSLARRLDSRKQEAQGRKLFHAFGSDGGSMGFFNEIGPKWTSTIVGRRLLLAKSGQLAWQFRPEAMGWNRT
jgi:hypothetical protein